MRVARALRLLLAAALLAAWQGALLHPLEHLDSHGGFVHVSGGHDSNGPGNRSGPNALCDAIAAVAICVGGAQQLSIVALTDPDPVPDFPGSPALGAPRLAYRSQAPPSLL